MLLPNNLLFPKKKILFPIYLLLIVIFIHSRNFSFDFSIVLDPYIFSGWLFSYKFGFMQRGLLGELLYFANIDVNYNNIRIIGFLIFLSIYFSLFKLFDQSLLRIALPEKDKNVILACLLFLPFYTSQLILELSRFDQVSQILSIFFLYLIIKNHHRYIIYAYIYAIIPFFTLMHEASIIIFIPTILLITYLKFEEKKPIIILSIFSLLGIILISKFGKITISQADLMIEQYSTYKKFNEYAFRTTTLSLFENIICNLQAFKNNKSIIPLILAGIFLYPIIIFFKKSFNFNFKFLNLLIPLSPLLLSIIAFDYFRWISLAIFNLTILFFYIILCTNINTSKLKNNIILYRKNIILYAAFSLFLGPFGVINIFPHIHKSNVGGLFENRLPDNIRNKLNIHPREYKTSASKLPSH